MPRSFAWMLLAAGALLAAHAAAAPSVERLEVQHEDGIYSVEFDVLIPVSVAGARAVLPDYRRWQNLSASITDSRLVDTLADGRQRVSVSLRSCVVFIFCRTVRQVKDMDTGAGRASFRTEMVAGQGDFASGSEMWEILEAPDRGTRLRYRATLVPAFALPPLLGPWIVKRELRRELLGTAASLERLLAQ
jgi:hypothetical protein